MVAGCVERNKHQFGHLATRESWGEVRDAIRKRGTHTGEVLRGRITWERKKVTQGVSKQRPEKAHQEE